jgi:peptidoglycan/LPS O-acetylase OafA/YrhL
LEGRLISPPTTPYVIQNKDIHADVFHTNAHLLTGDSRLYAPICASRRHGKKPTEIRMEKIIIAGIVVCFAILVTFYVLGHWPEFWPLVILFVSLMLATVILGRVLLEVWRFLSNRK